MRAARGAAELITSTAPPLGLLENSQFEETTIELRPGDAFLLYTDGLYGASKAEAERWTPARLQALIEPAIARARRRCSGKILNGRARREASHWPDDLAALVVRRVSLKARNIFFRRGKISIALAQPND